jgi:NAD(P)-dependent dehydrogenase (short-subunit alcohol dehydrogenase family)
MSTAAATQTQRVPQLLGQTVVVIGGSAGMGLETARQARAEGAKLVLTGRNPERLQRAATEVEAQSTAAFDASDDRALEQFFRDLPGPIDHVMVTAGRPTYGRMLEMDLAQVRAAVDEHLIMYIQVTRYAAPKMKPGGSLVFLGGTGSRRPGLGRVNLIAAGFVDTPLSAELLGDDLENRRKQLRETNLIRRVVESSDVAALAVHLMTNTALTGATYDIDGGQSLVAR